MTFPVAASSWVASRASKETRAAYSRDLALWLEHCRDTKADPNNPSADSVVAFRNKLQDTRAPLSVRRTLAMLSACYAAACPGIVNPFSGRRLPRPPARPHASTEAVSDEDARAAISAARLRGEAPLRDAALLWVLWSTGMRRISAVSIRRDGIVYRDKLMVLRHVLKGGEEVESELPPDAAAAVREWAENAPQSKWLFCSLDGSRALSPQSVTKIVGAAAREAGVTVRPHQFRSALITRALDAGIPLERVAKAVHHKDIRSTQRYDRGRRGAGVTSEVAAFRKSEAEP